ncbi:ribonuclease HIII [Mesomycoplasma molare]|uniref:Ribonuclease n=1 Tax=Mesomycoplasma molare TaxID=171288 RepID=A0ABY5TUV2_9BACT|nr:ribonuclease HIII [Mesomycoplasma molare]UWD34335.1 ribonuclease HIII [Mesomycoplasma molare]
MVKYKNIGCDETGVGDYLSPLIACAVIIPEENKSTLYNLGIRDSKKITSDKKIMELANKLKENTIFSLSFLSQEQYNKLNNFLNGNELKMLLHLHNINKLEKQYKVDNTIIDQFSTEKSILLYIDKLNSSSLQVEKIKSNLILETKAEDKFLEVACASILARDFLISKMDEQNKKWNFNFLLGAGKNVNNCALEFVKKHGIDNLNKVAKLHFKNTNDIKSEI